MNGAEDNRDDCLGINVDGTRHLVEAMADTGAILVQLSSDFVFGSDERTSYAESDVPGPLNVYGHSKLACEREAATCPRHFIVRTCGLYASRKSPRVMNFCETMLRLARSHPEVRVVNDQHVTPTYAPHLAGAIRGIARDGRIWHVSRG